MAQQSFIQPSDARPSGPVECLGMTFANDQERRVYFTERLREKLRDPEFRAIEGFPIGSDENILALSDPPYYTACPNPFIEDFVRVYGHLYDPNEPYSKEPFAAELAESRNNPFVNAHSYATKAPHQAIMRLLLHYTKPGDIVLDCFGGTGMTAVAAQLCEQPDDVFKQTILQELPNAVFGGRYAIIGDLSPAATFISRNYNLNDDMRAFQNECDNILQKVNDECGWMYITQHSSDALGQIICTIWSDVFVCPSCNSEIVFWDGAVELEKGQINDDIRCHSCGALNPKNRLEKAWYAIYDANLRTTIKQVKQVPVILVYEYMGKRYEKKPDRYDLQVIERVNNLDIPFWHPIQAMPDGFNTRQPRLSHGLTHVHHFFTKRNLYALSCAWHHAHSSRAKFMITSLMYKSSLLCAPLMSNYFAEKAGTPRGGWVGKERSGTLYCPSIRSEVSISSQIKTRSQSVRVTAASRFLPQITTGSATQLQLPDQCIDYIFTDPPFGANKMYSELNFMWEAWLGIVTDTRPEAIENDVQKKTLQDYELLMMRSFREYYRVLKPSRWITVEFSNTSAAVWNTLQIALGAAGFVVAEVRGLNKKQGSIKAYTSPSAMKQDLAISAYKPDSALEEEFALTSGSTQGVWDFTRAHLRHLPLFIETIDQKVELMVERQSQLLFDRMVAFHVQRGAAVPLSATEFYAGLSQRFPERDGMFFLPEQLAEYERRRMAVREVQQLQIFVTNESSAIQWVRQQLLNKPQTLGDLTPPFMRELKVWDKHELLPELRSLLDENFLPYDGRGPIPAQVLAWMRKSTDLRDLIANELANGAASEDNGALATTNPRLIAAARDRWYVPDPNKAIDLEKVRLRGLLKEFAAYREGRGKLKQFRTEAVKAGFAQAWKDRDYPTIVRVAERLPESVLQEDPDLLMYYDNASLRAG
jgi:hypothetical protein